MYYTLFDLINSVMFNGSATSGSVEYNALVLITLALTCMVAWIPFRAVISFVNSIISWR